MNNDEHLPDEVLAAIQANRKIEAIRFLRESRNIGLKEAKDIVDAYLDKHPADTTHLRPQPAEGGGIRLLLVAVAAAVIYGIYRYVS